MTKHNPDTDLPQAIQRAAIDIDRMYDDFNNGRQTSPGSPDESDCVWITCDALAHFSIRHHRPADRGQDFIGQALYLRQLSETPLTTGHEIAEFIALRLRPDLAEEQ